MTIDCMFEIFNLNITIRYRLSLLAMYRAYAKYTEERIVNYFAAFITDEDRFIDFSNQQPQSFQLLLIALSEKSLPSYKFQSSASYDRFVCELIDSEIRAVASSSIFDKIINKVRNSLDLV